MSVKIELGDLGKEIESILDEYGDEVYEAVEAGLDAAEATLINKLRTSSPEGKTKQYRNSWKSKGKRYKLKRYVHNTKMVKKGEKGSVPLSNILEYSEASKHQGLIKRTFDGSVDSMSAAFMDEFKKKI